MKLSLEFHLPERAIVDAQALRMPDVLQLAPGEVEKLILTINRHSVALGDACQVDRAVTGEDELVLDGTTRQLKFVGRSMKAGRLTVDGNTGYGAGMEMKGGEMEVLGNAGGGLGTAMQGGLIRVRGSGGDWCGASSTGQMTGMCGGMLLVDGNSGAFTGMGMRRGLILISGEMGEFCGERMIAGTILCAGRMGAYAGRGMKRGSIVAGEMQGQLPGFRDAGRADGEWLRIYLKALREMDIDVPAGWFDRAPRRFSGDHLAFGKGEILAYDLVE